MSTVPVYIVIRLTSDTEDIPLVRVQSQRFQNAYEHAFFTDQNIRWNLVANPFYTGHGNMAMITADVNRADKTTVMIVNQPKLQILDAERDLRELVATEAQKFMASGHVELNFMASEEMEVNGRTVWVDSMATMRCGSEPQRQWIRYTIRRVDAQIT